MTRFLLLSGLSLLACTGGTVINGGTGQLTPFEMEVVTPILEEVRTGVVPWDEVSVGVCAGNRSCDTFLGADPGELPAGDYLVQAVLKVPKWGPAEGWTAVYATNCTVTGTNSSSTKTYSKSYTLTATGSERGYRLAPLTSISSPAPGGATDCTWTLTLPHPDNPRTLSGHWSTPAR